MRDKLKTEKNNVKKLESKISTLKSFQTVATCEIQLRKYQDDKQQANEEDRKSLVFTSNKKQIKPKTSSNMK